MKSKTFYNNAGQVTFAVANWQSGFDPAACVFNENNLTKTNICTAYEYDAFGRQKSTKNALNQQSLTVYDNFGRPYLLVAGWNGTTNITSEANCIFNPPFQLADTNLCSVSYFDHFSRVDRTKNAKRQITTLEYDGLGRTASTIRPLSNVGMCQ